ncbi:unnamed protein product [Rodentolepis nana]|uniref:non-specific serine/threonine protein kinase n=1 Tax=Rodentolepis nana TaxID=102285 RepID=A0A0R3T011_RODNA|nr:unnamed protein product [Rodentolepis nana]
MTTIEIAETPDPYIFRILSSTSKDDNLKHKEVKKEKSLKKYTAIGIKHNYFEDIVKRERKILKRLTNCPFITRLRCTIYNERARQGWMVYDSFMEPQWDSLRPSLSIADIRSYVYQILSGLEFCHKKKIVHRNISWSSLHIDASNKRIQIGGWEYALLSDDIHPMEHDVKVPHFKSPERLLDDLSSCPTFKFDFAVDMWSAGCILGCLIFRKKYLFDDVDTLMTVLHIAEVIGYKAIMDFIKKYQIDYRLPFNCAYEKMTPIGFVGVIPKGSKIVATSDSIDLLKSLVVIDPVDRYSAERALQHCFFKDCDVSEHYLQRRKKPTSIFKVDIGVNIGSGTFSQVYKFREVRKAGRQKVVRELAVKYLRYNDDVRKERKKLAKREIKVLSLLRGCQNIIQFYGALKGGPLNYTCIIMEHIDALKTDAFFFTKLDDVRFYLYQLLLALESCHSHGIMHRDVKPANVLINYRTKQLRLIDFGLAEFYKEGRRYNLGIGTVRYLAPEILLNYEAFDMWAFGVALSSCIFKRRMLGSLTEPQLTQVAKLLGTSNLYGFMMKVVIHVDPELIIGTTDLPVTPWQSFVNEDNKDFATEDAIDLIDKLLVYDPNKRLNVKQAMEHPFFHPISTSHMGSSETNDIYEFHVRSSTKKDDYELHEVINVRSANKYLVKEIMTDDCKEILKKERKILYCLKQCPFILHLQCTIYNHKKNQGWLVYDFFTEPDWVSLLKSLSMDEIKSYVFQILSGIEFCHRQGIVHRNICWSSLCLDKQLKKLQIGGWQYALFHADVHPMEREVEMNFFKSPERLLGEYSRNQELRFNLPVDMWSIGCVLGCMLLRKTSMFDGVDWRMIWLNIEGILGSKTMLDFVAKYNLEYDFVTLEGFECSTGIDLNDLITGRDKNVVTDRAIDLLANLLVIDPEFRFTATKALRHNFFRNIRESSKRSRPLRDGSTIYKYETVSEEGFGSFSRVYKVLEVKRIESGKVCREFAVKHVTKWYAKVVPNEIESLKLLRGCPNIIQLQGVLDNADLEYACIFLEYFEGLTLGVSHFDTVDKLQFYLYQLLLALEACHSRGIMHRDVKPSNVLINYQTKQLRLIDFGLAEFYVEGVRYNCAPGTLRYKAPEVLLGHEKHNYAVDMWAFGVIFASCVFKTHIFDRSTSVLCQIMRILGTSGLLDYIEKLGDVDESYWQYSSTNYPALPWHSFINDENRNFATENALNLIEKLLVYDHGKRLKVEQAMQHPFFLPYSNISL